MSKAGRKWINALPCVLFLCFALTAAMAVYTWCYEPDRYQAEYSFFAMPAGGGEDRDALQLSRMLVRDCDALLNTQAFQDAVLADTASDGRTRLYALGKDGAHIIRVRAVGLDPQITADLANRAGKELLAQAPGVLGVREASELSLAVQPAVPFAPNRPLKTLWMLFGSFAGLSLLGMALGSSRTPLTWRQVSLDAVQLPCLGVIADYGSPLRRYRRHKRRECASFSEAVAQPIREDVREAALALRAAGPGCSLTVAGLSQADDAPAFSLLLASELATEGFPVLLMEMDAYAPYLRELLGISGHMDVSDCLRNPGLTGEAVRPTSIPGLSFIDACHAPGFVASLAATDAFAAFLANAARAYRFIILNAPPVHSLSDAAMLGAATDCVLLVLRSGRHSVREADAIAQRLRQTVKNLAGFVLWGAAKKRPVSVKPYRPVRKA